MAASKESESESESDPDPLSAIDLALLTLAAFLNMAVWNSWHFVRNPRAKFAIVLRFRKLTTLVNDSAKDIIHTREKICK
uniref:Uncharacterized protein n=1 Tax=Candidozyma auris TaxID=498019 RepID=A0A0L0P135_CANAR